MLKAKRVTAEKGRVDAESKEKLLRLQEFAETKRQDTSKGNHRLQHGY